MEGNSLWAKGFKQESINVYEQIFQVYKYFLVTMNLFNNLNDMKMYERAYHVILEAIDDFDNTYLIPPPEKPHPKYEEMYAKLVMNLWDVGIKIGKPELTQKIVQKFLIIALEKCKSQEKYIETFKEALSKLHILKEEEKDEVKVDPQPEKVEGEKVPDKNIDVAMSEAKLEHADNTTTQVSLSTEAEEAIKSDH